jgi:hypothetical protein
LVAPTHRQLFVQNVALAVDSAAPAAASIVEMLTLTGCCHCRLLLLLLLLLLAG